MALNQDQIKANIDAMQKQGASDKDIQGWLDTLPKSGADSSGSGGGFMNTVGGLAKDAATAVARPFVKVGSTIESGLAQTAAAGFSAIGANGVGQQFQSQANAVAPNVAKNPVDFAGNALEAASYGIAPLKGVGGGFWGAVKAIQPVAAGFGGAKALESAGQGDSLGDAALKGAGTYAGVTATAGLLGYGADLIKGWGAKLMQNTAVQQSMNYLKDFADNTFTALPEAFQKDFTSVEDLGNKNAARTAAALREEFNTGFGAAKNSIIDAAIPNVDKPEIATAQFNHAISDSMGKYFQKSNSLYEDVKADATTIDKFTTANDALERMPAPPQLPDRPNAADVQAYQRAAEKISPHVQTFLEESKETIKQPMNLRQIMALWQDTLSQLPNANNEEKVGLRNFASGLYADAKTTLSKTNPELLNDWEAAWSKWGDASRLWDSPVLNELKQPGNLDNYIAKISSGTLTPLEQDTIAKAISDPGMKGSTQDLLVSALMRQAKLQPPQEAAKTVNNFLDKFGDTFLKPDARAMLGKMASFFDSNFDQFVSGMRNQLPGLATDAADKLSTQQGQIDAFDAVSGKGIDQIVSQIGKIKDSPDFEKIVGAMNPEEKQAVGLAVTKDFFDKNMPLATQLPDGKFQVEKGFADNILKTWEMLSNNKGLQEAVGPDVVSAFKDGARVAENLGDASYVDDAKGMGKLYHAVVASVYLQRGWLPGALSNSLNVLKSAAGTGARFSSIEDLVDNGLIKPGTVFKIGDVLNHLSTLAAKGAGGELNNVQ